MLSTHEEKITNKALISNAVQTSDEIMKTSWKTISSIVIIHMGCLSRTTSTTYLTYLKVLKPPKIPV